MYAALQKPQYYTTTTNYNYVYDKLRTDISNHASVTNYNLYNRSLAKKFIANAFKINIINLCLNQTQPIQIYRNSK